MEKTRYEGVLYQTNRRNTKTFYARFKVKGKAYLRKLGEEPQINAKVASQLRYNMIDGIRNGETKDGKTMDDIFSEYIKLRSPTLSESWQYNMQKSYDKHIKDIIGDLTSQEVEIHMIQSQINTMLAKGYAVSTVKMVKDCLSGMYSHMLKDEVNIGRSISLPKFDNKVYFEITEDEAKRLYEVITTYEILMWRIFFSFLLHGRRRGEVAVLKWKDIKEDVYTVEADTNKTGKRIEAPMMSFLKDMLEEYENNSKHIFVGRYNNPVSKSGIDYHWTRIKERAGLPKMRLHDLRHLMGYIAINNGFSLEEIAQVLGHDSIATTKRYSNMSMNTAKRTLEAIHHKLK